MVEIFPGFGNSVILKVLEITLEELFLE